MDTTSECRPYRLARITGAASMRFDASITTQVAWFTVVRQVTIGTLERVPTGLPQGVGRGRGARPSISDSPAVVGWSKRITVSASA